MDFPEGELIESLERASAGIKAGAIEQYHGGRTLNGCGYGVFKDKGNSKPIYLIKQADGWKVLPSFHFYNFRGHQLTEEQEEAFEFLHAYFEQQKRLWQGR